MNSQAIRELLERAADVAGDEFRRPTLDEFRARRRGRRHTIVAVAASVGVVTVVAAVSVTLTGGRSATPTGHHHNGLPSVGHVTATQLRHYHWSALPSAPIAVRSNAASVWTGDQMLVWGGQRRGHHYADGAAYTPATRTWQVLPAAPLSARDHPFAIWTGAVMIVWGGHTGSRQLHDGAMYNPDTRHWTTMAAAPPAAERYTFDLVWGGRYAIRLSLNDYFAATRVQVDAFDPTSNTWTALPSIHVPSVNNYTGATAALAGTRLVVWVSNGHSFELNPAGTRWQPVPYSPDIAGCIYQVIPTSDSIIYPADYGSVSCGGDLAFGPGVRGSELSLDNGKARRIAYTPTTDAGCRVVWTGAALLNIAANPMHEMGVNSKAGATTAWDPNANRWIPLDTAPGWSQSAAWIWTGTQLIGWGNLVPAHRGGHTPPGLTLSA